MSNTIVEKNRIKLKAISKIYFKNKKKIVTSNEKFILLVKLLFGKKSLTKEVEECYALKNISFEIKQSDSFGIIGLNGSGKSTLLQIIAGTLKPSNGVISVEGKVAALLELGSGFNADFTGRENAVINAKIFGLSDADVREIIYQIEEFAEIGDYFDLPVRTYSSGMVLRVAFSVIVHVNPDILIIDEALAVGDARFQLKCFDFIENFKLRGGTLILVSHDMNIITRLCDYSILLNKGDLICSGKSIDVVNQYSLLISNYSNEFPLHQIKSVSEQLGSNEQKIIKQKPKPISYGGQVGEIKSVLINSMETAFIKAGEEFNVSFNVIAYDNIYKPIFAFRIRDSRGQEIYGTNTKFLKHNVCNLYKGKSLRVTFTQYANLGVGKYFISIGFTCFKNNELHVIHRLRECVEFEVYNDDESFGCTNCYSKVKVE